MNQPQITPELVASHGLKPDEYERILKLIGRSSASMLTDEIEVGGNQRFVAHHRVNRQLAHRAPPIGEARKGTFRPMEVMRTMRREYVADPEAISLLSSAGSA